MRKHKLLIFFLASFFLVWNPQIHALSPSKKSSKKYTKRAKTFKKYTRGMSFVRIKKKKQATKSRGKRMHLIVGYLMDRFEVTVAEYKRCVAAGSCRWPTNRTQYCNAHKVGRSKHPMNCVSWQQAHSFCRWKGKRLPSQNEWLYAVNGSNGNTYPWGNQPPNCQRAVYKGNGTKAGCDRDGTWPVGSKKRGNSSDGISDLVGNVAEWSADCAKHNKQGRCTHRYALGGSWQSMAAFLHPKNRKMLLSSKQSSPFVGFRCAMDAPAWLLATNTEAQEPIIQERHHAVRPEPIVPIAPKLRSYRVSIPHLLLSPCNSQCKNWDRFGGVAQNKLLEIRARFRKLTATLPTRYCWQKPNGVWACRSKSKMLWLFRTATILKKAYKLYAFLAIVAKRFKKYRPDPYVTVTTPRHTITFRKRSDTFSPSWTKAQSLLLKYGDRITVRIYDKDFIGKDQISRFTFYFTPPPIAQRHKTFRYIHNHRMLAKEVTLQFAR